MANDIEQILKNKLLKAVKKLPVVIKNEVVNISNDAFKTESWEGAKWPARAEGANRNNGRALLVDTAILKRSIPLDTVIEGDRVTWATNVPYARIHNDGGVINQAAKSETFRRNRVSKGKNKGRFKKGTTAGQGHTYGERNIKIPQRRFMGNTPAVRDRLIQKAKSFLLNAIKQ